MEKKRCRGNEDLVPRYVIEILLWLPVVSLLRFKSVCKSWRALIESSFFIDIYTNATTFNSASSSSKFGSFILHAAVRSYLPTIVSEHALFMVSSVSDDDDDSSGSGSGSAGCWWSTTSCWKRIVLCTTGNTRGMKYQSDDDCYDDRVFKVVMEEDSLGGGESSIDQLVLKLDNLGFPSRYKFNTSDFYNKEIVIAGSCNGLVCLHDRETSFFNTGPHEVYLLNPATRQGRILPKPITIDRDPGHHNSVAFGFDVQTQDYKVVLLTTLHSRWNGNGPSECFCRVQVYSLSTDSWKLLEGIPCLPGYPFVGSTEYGMGLHLNGSCFFLAHFFYTRKQPRLPVNDRFIISFDFTNEIITPIQLPDHHRNHKLYLCYMGDNKIALFTVLIVYQDETCGIPIYEDFNIWVLNEHRSTSSSSLNKGSWTKLHSFQIETLPCMSYIPTGISNDGKFVLLETTYLDGLGKKMNLYNLVTKELKRSFLSCCEVMSKAHPYKPSLVSIIGGNGAQVEMVPSSNSMLIW